MLIQNLIYTVMKVILLFQFSIIMERIKLIRNPYPIPDLSSEGIWVDGGPVLGKNVKVNDKHWDSYVKPHERLFSHQTLNSARRNCRYVLSANVI